jgi:ribosomal protein L29
MKVKQKLSELFDALHTENAELHRKNLELNEENIKLRAELFHLRGQTQKAVVPDLLDEEGL